MKFLLKSLIASVVALSVLPASAEPVAGRELAIVAPTPVSTTLDEDGDVVIAFAADPPLAEGDRIVVLVDDQIMVLPSGATRFALTGIPLGMHALDAIIVDADANPVAAAGAVTFRVGAELRI